MNGFGLILGHLIGDYLVQNDWMAANKTNGPAGEEPRHPSIYVPWTVTHTEAVEAWNAWIDARWAYRRGHLACTVHCLCYTLAVWACSFWWMPWWGLVATFALHWPVDRFRLAGRWMRNVSGQAAFASGPLSPWSVIVVDNTFHLIVLFVIGVIAK